MSGFFRFAAAILVASGASISQAFAQTQLGIEAGGTVPFGGGGVLLGLAAAGVVSGIWIARRKR